MTTPNRNSTPTPPEKTPDEALATSAGPGQRHHQAHPLAKSLFDLLKGAPVADRRWFCSHPRRRGARSARTATRDREGRQRRLPRPAETFSRPKLPLSGATSWRRCGPGAAETSNGRPCRGRAVPRNLVWGDRRRPPAITGFRAVFADDIAVEMPLPKKATMHSASSSKSLLHIATFLIFTKAALSAHVETRPDGTREVEPAPPGQP